ncbi:YDG domain-containing protein [Lysinibacillus sp. NPDC096418]|uniref:YDG domain-containing protein n=1 Tax=Lysinibacillus sp. NPDC096418 TaxID=3364138 RepID=UPI00380A602B
MSIKNKFVKATVGVTLAVSSVPIFAPIDAQATTFPDVPKSAYYYDAVHVLAERGIVTGYVDQTFKPNVAVTRGQLAKILAGILGLDTQNVVDPGFTDVLPSNPYFGAIAALVQAGIINGYEDHTFRTNEPLQRNHLAKILVKAFDLQAPEGATMPLKDVHQEYRDYIFALYTNGITTGRTATQFDGTSYVTRGQLAVFVVRTEAAIQPTANEKEQGKEKEQEKPKTDPNPPIETQPKPAPSPNLTFTMSIEGLAEIFSTDKEVELVTSAVIARMYMDGDAVKITFVSEEAIPKESFKVKIRNVEYEFKFNKNENKWVAAKFKEAISSDSEYRPTPDPAPSSPSAISVTGITLNTTTATIIQGETAQLTASILPVTATNKNVTWTSSDKNVATVDNQGKVTAIGVGNATITVKTVDGAKLATATIEVVIPVTGITLDETSGILHVGDSKTLTATVTPTNATNKNVAWTSSDKNVATVDSQGKVTAIGVGNATITATTADGSKTATATYTVTQKVLSVTVPTVASKIYDGTTEATVTPGTVTGIASGDDVVVSAGGTFDNAKAGTGKTVEVTYSLSGTDASKYTAPASTTGTADITPKTLSVTTPTVVKKEYDGTTAATVTHGLLSGVAAGDDVTVSAVATYDDANVGTNKTITVVYTLGGADASNYTAPVNTVVTTGEITAIPVTAIGTIKGIPQVGQTLTAGAITPAGATVTYQWQIANTTTGAYTDITGETSDTYTPVAADTGKFIQVVATGTGNYSGPAISVPTIAVTPQ